MVLSKQNLESIARTSDVIVPDESIFSLPEKVLQFGTGVFLRGLIDYLIDKANKQNVFNGRVVVVKSTGTGDMSAFAAQDSLYTLLIKSIDEGKQVDETVIIAAISRVLSAKNEWNEILKCAENPEMQIIISNTTEVGISLQKDDKADALPPSSFPGKLLSFLWQRYKVFKGSKESGMVIIPTELIPDNATKLKNIVNELARENDLDKEFIDWLNNANDFCNSLVDRIVPGKLPPEAQLAAEEKLGYKDELMIMSESYALWAIESSSEITKEKLSFSKADEGVVIVDNIDKYRELKLRLLNGSHNLSSALGYIAGFATVKEAMADEVFSDYMTKLILEEIAAAIVNDNITMEDAKQFGTKVLDRYRNPYIEFEWLSICVQDTSKIRIRAVPIILSFYKKYRFVPDNIALGIAGYILFMRSEQNDKGQYVGSLNGKEYIIEDDYAASMNDKWKTNDEENIANAVLKDESLWETDLSRLAGFTDKVSYFLKILIHEGFFAAVRTVPVKV